MAVPQAWAVLHVFVTQWVFCAGQSASTMQATQFPLPSQTQGALAAP
jgi:hypothetical protein